MYLKIKRIIDVICAMLGLIILSPLIIFIVLAIKIDSKGPILFKQKRVGMHKRHFYILKFRTMRVDSPGETPTHLLENPEQWITRVGRFLRKTSLDELPQILNILKGDMSVIGPRPALWNQYDLIEQRDLYKANDVPPGITGWAQINGRDSISIEKKAELDGYYVENISCIMDIRCFIGTIVSVIKGDGVIEGGTGSNAGNVISSDGSSNISSDGSSNISGNGSSAGKSTAKRVLILVNHGVTIYNFRRELVERLLRDDFEVTISAPYDEKVDKIIKMGCHFINTPIERHGTSIIEEIQLLRFYKKIIADAKPDIVLTYTVKPNIYGGIACKRLRIPYISSVTGLGNALVKKGVLQKITIFLYKFATSKISRLFLQNEENMNFFVINRIAIGKHRIVSGSGVNLTQNAFEPYPDESEPIRLLFIGRIMKEKGIDELAKAAVNVKKKYPLVVFDAIGFCEDEYKPMMEAFAKTGEINFLGPKSDVHEYLKQSHAVVMPSHHEGMSNALLEAASVGRPVIASMIPGCVETFDEGVSGIGFEVENAEDLTQKLFKFIEMPYESKVRMGIAGRSKMELEFDREKVVDAYMEEINMAIKKRGNEQ